MLDDCCLCGWHTLGRALGLLLHERDRGVARSLQSRLNTEQPVQHILAALVGLEDLLGFLGQLTLFIPNQLHELELGIGVGVLAAGQLGHFHTGDLGACQDALVHQELHRMGTQGTFQTGHQIRRCIGCPFQTKGLNDLLAQAIDHHVLSGAHFTQGSCFGRRHIGIFFPVQDSVDVLVRVVRRLGCLLSHEGESGIADRGLDVLVQVHNPTLCSQQELAQVLITVLRILVGHQVLSDLVLPLGSDLAERLHSLQLITLDHTLQVLAEHLAILLECTEEAFHRNQWTKRGITLPASGLGEEVCQQIAGLVRCPLRGLLLECGNLSRLCYHVCGVQRLFDNRSRGVHCATLSRLSILRILS